MKKFSLAFLSMIVFVSTFFASISFAAAEPELKSLIPAMTSNTAPSGVASASTYYDNNVAAYKAFDGIRDYSVGISSYTAWGTKSTTGWLAYQFETPKVVKKYVIYYGTAKSTGFTSTTSLPISWTFEGSVNGTDWTTLSSVEDFKNWGVVGPYTFEITNNTAYTSYRINITKNNGSTTANVNLTIHEMEMWGYDASEQVPEQPVSDRALLTIYISGGQIKEYDLSTSELSTFLNWYDAKDAGSGPAKYAFTKTWNKGPFKMRTEYVIFDKILTFDVDEYDVTNP